MVGNVRQLFAADNIFRYIFLVALRVKLDRYDIHVIMNVMSAGFKSKNISI